MKIWHHSIKINVTNYFTLEYCWFHLRMSCHTWKWILKMLAAQINNKCFQMLMIDFKTIHIKQISRKNWWVSVPLLWYGLWFIWWIAVVINHATSPIFIFEIWIFKNLAGKWALSTSLDGFFKGFVFKYLIYMYSN